MSIDPLKVEGLTVTPSIENGAMRVVLIGAVEMRDPGEVLTPYWNRLDDAAIQHKVKQVDVDLRDLNFMNSSGILTLVRWITKLKGHASYNMTLRYDRNVTWQRTSIPTLAKLAPNVVTSLEING